MAVEILMQSEQVSALVDGELRGEECVQALAQLSDSEDARAHWYAYHLVGDVMRSPELARGAMQDADFVQRLRERLQDERGLSLEPPVQLLQPERRESANDNQWRWVAGLASLAALAVVGWQLLADQGAMVRPSQLVEVVAPGAGEMPRMIRDPRLDQLLAAHQQSGGTSALQMPAGFLRNATFEQPAR